MSEITAQFVYEEQRKLRSLQFDLDNTLHVMYEEQADAARQGHISMSSPEDHPNVRALRAKITAQAAVVADKQDAIGGRVYRVPAPNVGVLESKIAKIGRRATKLGTDPITLSDSGEREHVEYKDGDGRKQIREYRFMVLAGDTPRVPGFEFLATVEHHEAGNIVKRIPQIRADVRLAGMDVESIDLTQYRTGTADCEHCHLARNRKDTFVVFNKTEGTLVQVGRNCLGDYTGLHNPERVADMAEWLRDFDMGAEGEDDETWSSGRMPEMWLTTEYLAHTATCIRTYGWTPRSAVSYGGEATADQAINNLRYYGKTDRKTGAPMYVTVTDEDAARGEAAMEWVRDLPESARSGDYMHNLFIACSLEAITSKQAGIVASAIAAHDRAMQRETERMLREQRRAAAANEFLGVAPDEAAGIKGERLRDLEVVITGIREIERAGYGYGDITVTYLYSFEDARGNVVKWFASSDQSLKIGDAVKLTGTVKKHDVYQGTNQTVLTRCKAIITKEADAA